MSTILLVIAIIIMMIILTILDYRAKNKYEDNINKALEYQRKKYLKELKAGEK